MAVTACTALARRPQVGEDSGGRDADVAAWLANRDVPVVGASTPRGSTAVFPLAAVERGGVDGLRARHGHVLASGDLRVLDVAFLDEDALTTGSDYAVVVVDLACDGPGETQEIPTPGRVQ